MHVCTSCSERWDTAEDGGGDYRWVVYHVSREHSTSAVGTYLPISSKRVHCCIHASLIFFFVIGMLTFTVRAYLV